MGSGPQGAALDDDRRRATRRVPQDRLRKSLYLPLSSFSLPFLFLLFSPLLAFSLRQFFLGPLYVTPPLLSTPHPLAPTHQQQTHPNTQLSSVPSSICLSVSFLCPPSTHLHPPSSFLPATSLWRSSLPLFIGAEGVQAGGGWPFPLSVSCCFVLVVFQHALLFAFSPLYSPQKITLRPNQCLVICQRHSLSLFCSEASTIRL